MTVWMGDALTDVADDLSVVMTGTGRCAEVLVSKMVSSFSPSTAHSMVSKYVHIVLNSYHALQWPVHTACIFSTFINSHPFTMLNTSFQLGASACFDEDR